MFAFIASWLGMPTIYQVTNLVMGCSDLIDTPSYELHQYFVSTSLAIQNYLDSEDMYGTFFLTESNLKWMLFAKFYAKQLIMHQFIDSNTRKVSVFTVLRSLGDEDLFYALVTVTFSISVSGQIEHEFDVQYVPIIQYYYGLDGYPYMTNEVLVSELLFLIPFTLVALCAISFKIYVRYFQSGKGKSSDDRNDDNYYHGSGGGGGEVVEHDDMSGHHGNRASEVMDPFGLPSPPSSRRRSPIRSADRTLIQDEDGSSYSLDDMDSSDSDNSDVMMRLHLQQRRNTSLSRRMEQTNASDITLKDFSSMLLPDVEDFENMSSASEDDDSEQSDDVESKTADDHYEDHGLAMNVINAPVKSIKVLKKQVSFVKKRSTKSIKNVTKIINKNKTDKRKKYFSLLVIAMFIITLFCRLRYIQGAREMHIFMTSHEVTAPTGGLFSGYDTHFEDIIDKFKSLQNYEIVGRTLSVVCIFFCKCLCLLRLCTHDVSLTYFANIYMYLCMIYITYMPFVCSYVGMCLCLFVDYSSHPIF